MRRTSAAVFFAVLSVLALTGCSVMSTTAAPGISTGASIQGIVHGGQQAIAGSHVYLLAANPNHYSTLTQHGSNSLLTAAANTTEDTNSNYYVTTAADGSFNISGDYTCTSGEQVYLYANGGYSDGNPADANAAIGLMAVLGPCPGAGNFATQTPFVWINEVTTVAAAYALSGFAADSDHIGAPSATSTLALTGIQNAFNNAFNLAELSTGTACTHTASAAGGDCITSPNASGTAPTSTLNTLANILAACVNTTSPTSSNCTTLFENATFTGASTGSLGNEGVNPTDTATAAICMAQHPGANVSNLFGLQAGVAAPFAPNLGTTPNDLTVPLSFSNSAFNEVVYFAIDASGNLWTGNFGSDNVSELSPFGTSVNTYSLGGTTLRPLNVAIDTSGDAWVVDSNESVSAGSMLVKLGPTGSLIGSYAPTGSNFSSPDGLAIDASGNAWIANATGDTVTEVSSSGSLVGNYFDGSLDFPGNLAIAATGDIWVDNYYGGPQTAFSSTGTLVGAYQPTGNGFGESYVVAVDGAGNVWFSNIASNSVTALSSSGSLVGKFTGSGNVSVPTGLAIDAANNVWVTNSGNGSIVELNSAGTFIGKYTAGLSSPHYIAPDASGNIWISDTGTTVITELVGAGTPTVTPIVANLVTPYGAAAVNKP